MLFIAMAVLFLVACLAARAYRSRVGPLLANRLPASIARPVSAGVDRGLSAVEDFTTHELASMLASRIQGEAASAAAKVAAEERLDKLRTVLDPAGPKPAATAPKP